jgi:hypothetical protein
MNGIVACLLPVLCFAAFLNTESALKVWLLLTPLSSDVLFRMGLGMTFDRLAVPLIVVGALAQRKQLWRSAGARDPIETALAVFVGAIFLRSFLTLHPKVAIVSAAVILDNFVLPFLVLVLVRSVLLVDGRLELGVLRRLLTVLVINGGVIAAMGIYEGLTGVDLLPGPENRFDELHGGGLRLSGGILRVTRHRKPPGGQGLDSWLLRRRGATALTAGVVLQHVPQHLARDPGWLREPRAEPQVRAASAFAAGTGNRRGPWLGQ